MKCLVTGAAGFIGSHLTDRLLEQGWEVVGMDSLTPYYSRQQKKDNLSLARQSKKFKFVQKDVLKADLKKLLDGTACVFHLAAQPGVLASWGTNFSTYIRDNVLTTQKLLEAARDSKIKKFVYASSSSVYGNSPLPMREDGVTRPFSPYGVTKLAGENLVQLYHKNFGVPSVCLRYFTVFGPRQRPDMGFYKFISAILRGKKIILYGDGRQSRDVTYVGDVVQANLLAMLTKRTGEIYNVGGGNRTTVNQVIRMMEKLTGRKAGVTRISRQKGDVLDTEAHQAKSRKELGFHPQVGLEAGLKKQVAWMKGKMAV